jgi:ubiquinone/menaquinone biosynthesis C-methylase UbiE
VNFKHLIKIFIIILLTLPVSGLSQQTQTVLDPENDNEARLNRLLPPEEILDAVGAIPGMTVAEIGAGRGRFVIPLAMRVGESGKVFAEDIDRGALRHLENRCEKWDIFNVETVRGDVTDPKLPAGELDLIIVVSSYHHFEDPVALLQKAKSALKPNGRLAIAEWLPWSKNDREGTTHEEMQIQMNAAGYELIRIESLDVAKPLNVYVFK